MAKSKAIALLHSHGQHHHLGRRLFQYRIVHPQVTHAQFPRGDIHPLVGIHSLAIPCHDRRLVPELAPDSIEHLLAVSSRERGEMALGCGGKLELVGASLQSPHILGAPRVVSGPIHPRLERVGGRWRRSRLTAPRSPASAPKAPRPRAPGPRTPPGTPRDPALGRPRPGKGPRHTPKSPCAPTSGAVSRRRPPRTRTGGLRTASQKDPKRQPTGAGSGPNPGPCAAASRSSIRSSRQKPTPAEKPDRGGPGRGDGQRSAPPSPARPSWCGQDAPPPAIINLRLARQPRRALNQFEANHLVEQLVAGLKGDRGAELPRRLEWTDLVAIDDLHALAEQPVTQMEVARTLEGTVSRGGRVACALGGSPAALPVFAEALRRLPDAHFVAMRPARGRALRASPGPDG